MKRREAIRTIGAAPLLGISAASLSATSRARHERAPATSREPEIEAIALGDAHFLSKSNPTATAAQRELETQALALLKTPAIQRAQAQAAERFRILAGGTPPAEASDGFDARMEEWAYHYVALALASDANDPVIWHHDYGPPHEWFGMRVPGSRGPGTGENVDNAYSVFAVDGVSRYELHGRRMTPPTGDCPIHVVGNLSMSSNISAIGIRDTDIAADGSFTITIGPEPADGRRNHLQTTADARYVFIRDARANWEQVPSAFRVWRVDPPTAPPLTLDEKAAMAARFIVDDVAMNYWFRQMTAVLPANSVAMPDVSALFGGQPSQLLGRGHLQLADDEAFVLTVDPEGSDYYTIVLYDWWLMSGDYWSRTSSLNRAQSLPDADGRFTYVFSAGDPGVHNWIDTLGWQETLFFIRFQLLKRDAAGTFTATPRAAGRRVKLRALDDALPPGVARISAEARKQQIAARHAAFLRRFAT